ncbi:MAG: NrsF family protein, partial [Myxococcota bacterium]
IESLVGDLRPVRRPGDVRSRTALWVAASGVGVALLVRAVGPLRPGVVDQLLATPRLALEAGLGVAALCALAYAAFLLGIPGRPRRAGVATALGLAVLWVAAIVSGFVWPVLEPSMVGKREDCWVDVLWMSIPSLLGALFLLRSLAPFDRAATGTLAGLAAGLLPGFAMQWACMYDPHHAMTHHLAPILVMGIVGAVLGRLAIRRV